MKASRFRFSYRENTSALHKAVGEVLRSSTLFSGHQIYQEYPVVRINTNYSDSSHHFDWAIPGLFLVIECHGKQHYSPVDFSGKAEDGGIGALQDTRRRDNQKKNAAIEAGFTYIEIPYTAEKLLTEEYIWGLYQENLNEIQPKQSCILEETTESDYSIRLRERAKTYRKSAYLRAKERRMEVRSRGTAEPSLQGKGTSKN